VNIGHPASAGRRNIGERWACQADPAGFGLFKDRAKRRAYLPWARATKNPE
jgi:hypothetical protein